MVPGVEHWVAELTAALGGQRTILFVPSLASAAPMLEELRSVGIAEVLVVGGRRGVGPLPDLPADRVIDLGVPPAPVLDEIRAVRRALGEPSVALRNAVERFDPDGEAVVIGDPFNELPALLGRRFLAFRRPEWIALEDKTTVDGFWDRCKVTREPSEVVELTRAGLATAAARLDRGHGTVVAADSSSGWHGGASLVTRILPGATPDSIRSVVAAFTPVASNARVMPFVRGVPCSIHGIVFPDRVVTLRPVEMIVLLQPDGGFFYAGSASFFDPDPAARDEMRSIARRVGAVLRTEVGFRGAFTVDGILGADGFRPTELNPRNGAGTRPLTAALGLPFQLLLDAVVAGVDLDGAPDSLEALMVETADAHRDGATYRQLPIERPAASGELVVDGRRVRRTAVGEPPDLRYRIVPDGATTSVRCTPVADRIPPGPPFGPVAAAFWAWADHEYDLGLGELRACEPT